MSALVRIARHGGIPERAAVAAGEATPPELLTFLAADPAPEVRAAVAANHATPPQAGLLLAEDADLTVRGSLARRLGGAAPEAEGTRRARLVGALLTRLAQDAAAEVRVVLSEALARRPDAPRDVILRLAADTERLVAEPVLRLSPLLSEAALIALVTAPPAAFTRERIASRPQLPEAVAEAVVASADSPAIATLLGNASAAIREATLDQLVEGAAEQPIWGAALVRRPRLSHAALRRLGELVAGRVLAALAARPDLPEEIAATIRERLAERLDTPEHWLREGADRAAAAARLAEAAGITPTRMDAALALRSPRVIAALCWHAGWSAADAASVQAALGVAPDRVLAPTPEGGWAMTEEELRWQVELLDDLPG